ncbi:MAG: type II toxin-antitoxin system PemK/MazF family toxin [Candidatus Aminicenantes bacterium]|nr:type II toxin-antitoxin system PemK/MazF family toxin [Candidatus Aminicenantes bacterium]
MHRGEIRWYRFDHPDKRRPVVILTRDSIIPWLGEVTVAPITTNIRNIPSEVVLTVADGLPRDCAVNCDHLQTVPRGRLGVAVARLNPAKMDEVATAVRFALALG